VAVLARSRRRWLERLGIGGHWEWRSRVGFWLARANLCSGFAETDPGSFNNTVAEKQVSSSRHFPPCATVLISGVMTLSKFCDSILIEHLGLAELGLGGITHHLPGWSCEWNYFRCCRFFISEDWMPRFDGVGLLNWAVAEYYTLNLLLWCLDHVVSVL